MGEAHQVGNDRRVFRIVFDPLDERQVDLDDVDREVAQVLERGEAGPEVVERDADALLMQLVEQGSGSVRGRAFDDDRGLGDLQADRQRLEAGGLERAAHGVDDPRVGELHRPEVDPGGEVSGKEPSRRAHRHVAGYRAARTHPARGSVRRLRPRARNVRVTRARVGDRQRTSASTPTIFWESIWKLGW